MEEALIELVQAFKKVAYKKYQKRVLNRKKLFAKRKAKYGR